MPILAKDSSGNGRDLFYSNPDVVFGIPGYVTGNRMVQNVTATSGFLAGATAIDMSSLSGNDLFFNLWTDLVPPSGTGPAFVSFLGDDSSAVFFDSSTGGVPAGSAVLHIQWNTAGDPAFGIGAIGVFPAGPHMVSVRLDIGALGGQFYLDGAPFGSFVLAGGPMPNVDTTGTLLIGGKSGNSPFYDEIAIGAQPTVDSDFSNLYAQAGNFANYNAAQMAMVPEFYYHLDDSLAGWHVGRIGMGA